MMSEESLKKTTLISTISERKGNGLKLSSSLIMNAEKALLLFEKIRPFLSRNSDVDFPKIKNLNGLFFKDQLFKPHLIEEVKITVSNNPEYYDLDQGATENPDPTFYSTPLIEDFFGIKVNCLPIIDPELIKLVHGANHPRDIWRIVGVPLIIQNTLTILVLELKKTLLSGVVDYSNPDKDNLLFHIQSNYKDQDVTIDDVWIDCEMKFKTKMSYYRIYRALKELADEKLKNRNSFGERVFTIPPINVGVSVNETIKLTKSIIEKKTDASKPSGMK
jgi:hypothetical protein